MDECDKCIYRGYWEKCQDTVCSKHESWMVQELRNKLNIANSRIHSMKSRIEEVIELY